MADHQDVEAADHDEKQTLHASGALQEHASEQTANQQDKWQQDVLQPSQQQDSQHRKQPKGTRMWRFWHIWPTAILIGYLLGRSCPMTHHPSQAATSAECMHALGGGLVGNQGTFPHVLPTYCLQQQAEYAASGDYLREVNATAVSALVAFGLLPPDRFSSNLHAQAAAGVTQAGDAAAAAAAAAGGAAGISQAEHGALRQGSNPYPEPSVSSLFVFDIDETALSNLKAGIPFAAGRSVGIDHDAAQGAANARAAAAAGAAAGGAAGAAGTGAAGIMHSIIAAKAAHLLAGNAPPLLPVRQLYLSLQSAGYAVAFVTGRTVSGRTATLLNLEAAGYGRPCDGDGSEISPPAAEGETRDCFAALMMRPHGDTRLASVYKPAARAELENAGYSIIGSIGDQFSDLSGTSAGDYSFKLPNVWYYIL